MFIPTEIFYEKEIENYPLGKELIKKYREKNVPCTIIENHNAIEVMRKKENKAAHFPSGGYGYHPA